MEYSYEQNIELACETIKSRIKTNIPKLAVILGSGLAGIADNVQDAVSISYKELSGFPVPTVDGHDGYMVIGNINNVPVICLKGRVHAYESHDFTALKTLVRTLKALGVETLMTTSSSGSLSKNMPVGSIMAITDHINFMGVNPLFGKNDDSFGVRFPALKNAWNADTVEILKQAANSADVSLYEGVYFAFHGPSFETPAEIRMAKLLGGDAIGMSAVPECILANHCGLNVVGCAIISNMAEGMTDEVLSHDHTIIGAKQAERDLSKLIEHFVPSFL